METSEEWDWDSRQKVVDTIKDGLLEEITIRRNAYADMPSPLCITESAILDQFVMIVLEKYIRLEFAFMEMDRPGEFVIPRKVIEGLVQRRGSLLSVIYMLFGEASTITDARYFANEIIGAQFFAHDLGEIIFEDSLLEADAR